MSSGCQRSAAAAEVLRGLGVTLKWIAEGWVDTLRVWCLRPRASSSRARLAKRRSVDEVGPALGAWVVLDEHRPDNLAWCRCPVGLTEDSDRTHHPKGVNRLATKSSTRSSVSTRTSVRRARRPWAPNVIPAHWVVPENRPPSWV